MPNSSSNSNNLVVTLNSSSNSILVICSIPGSRRCLDTTNIITDLEVPLLHNILRVTQPMGQEERVDLEVLLGILPAPQDSPGTR